MINLYSILNLLPSADEKQIQIALSHYEANSPNPDPKVIKAVNEWLLVADVRARYDRKLRTTYPEFFGLPNLNGKVDLNKPNQPKQPNQPNQSNQPNQQNQPNPNSDDEMGSDAEYAEYDEYYVPRLWNPVPLAIWSFLLTAILGAWLQAINWRELGNEELAKKNMNWVYGIFGLSAVLMLLEILFALETPLWFGSVIWVVWYFTLGKQQTDFIKREIGDNNYEKRGWGKPLGLTIAGIIAFIIVSLIVMMLLMIVGAVG